MCVDHSLKNGTLRITNQPRIQSTLQRFCMEEAKTVLTPVSSGVRLEPDEDREPCGGPDYELVEVLLYLANTVRPDILLVVVCLSRFCYNPKSSHFVSAKRVHRYLKSPSPTTSHIARIMGPIYMAI